MAKWKSPLFSDIRNKLGENVVFSMWKGRPYMRSYVTPANPNSLKQQANRDQMRKIVALYQLAVKGIPENEAAWNIEALPRLISGYNQFTQYGRKITYGTVTLAAATLSVAIMESGIPSDRLAVMIYDVSEFVYFIPTTKRGVGTYTAADYEAYTPAVGDRIYIADTKVLAAGDGEENGHLYKAVNHWKVNEATGIADALVVTT